MPALFVEGAELIPLAYRQSFPNARYARAEKIILLSNHLKNVRPAPGAEYSSTIGFPARYAVGEDISVGFSEKTEHLAVGQKIKKRLILKPACRV